ncbi:hypothetical protein BGZ54_007472 [Gamsiella multidivaricata]|nr:hypothetical protein BGZ54_007472 [Gamsiella multidivaricata]
MKASPKRDKPEEEEPALTEEKRKFKRVEPSADTEFDIDIVPEDGIGIKTMNTAYNGSSLLALVTPTSMPSKSDQINDLQNISVHIDLPSDENILTLPPSTPASQASANQPCSSQCSPQQLSTADDHYPEQAQIHPHSYHDNHIHTVESISFVNLCNTEFSSTHLLIRPHYPYQLPLELWEVVASHLYPSQLTRLSQTCKALYGVVARLSLWRLWYENLFEAGQFGGLASAPFYPPDLHQAANMLYICARSFRICEECACFCKEWHCLGMLMQLPLSVTMPPSTALSPSSCSLSSTSTSTSSSLSLALPPAQPDNDQAHEAGTPWSIRMCLRCRQKYYAEHPEPELIKPDIDEYLSLHEMKSRFGFGKRKGKRVWGRRIRNMPGQIMIEYPLHGIWMIARAEYGGDVGINSLDWDHEPSLAKEDERIRYLDRKAVNMKIVHGKEPPLRNVWLPLPPAASETVPKDKVKHRTRQYIAARKRWRTLKRLPEQQQLLARRELWKLSYQESQDTEEALS